MTRTIQFKSKKDCREFKIKVPESSSEDNENNNFIEINDKTRIVEEIFSDDPQREELLPTDLPPGDNFTRHTFIRQKSPNSP